MKRRILLVGLAVVLVVALAGCGGDDGNNLDGMWERYPGSGFGYEFSGRNFNFNFHTITAAGTFSISGDYIEFVYANGNIVVRPFSRTENTIVIGQTRYTRASGSGGSATPAPAVPATPAPTQPEPAAPTPAAPTHTVGYGELDGRWERWSEPEDESGVDSIHTIFEFSGNRFIIFQEIFLDDGRGHFTFEHSGTFSISDGRMERVFEEYYMDFGRQYWRNSRGIIEELAHLERHYRTDEFGSFDYVFGDAGWSISLRAIQTFSHDGDTITIGAGQFTRVR